MLMRQEHPWRPLLAQYGAGMALNFHEPAGIALHARTFYHQNPIPDTFYWDYEEKKLFKLLDSLF
jgi:hypothetical protein